MNWTKTHKNKLQQFSTAYYFLWTSNIKLTSAILLTGSLFKWYSGSKRNGIYMATSYRCSRKTFAFSNICTNKYQKGS